MQERGLFRRYLKTRKLGQADLGSSGDAIEKAGQPFEADAQRQAIEPLFRRQPKGQGNRATALPPKAGAKEKTILRQWFSDMGPVHPVTRCPSGTDQGWALQLVGDNQPVLNFRQRGGTTEKLQRFL